MRSFRYADQLPPPIESLLPTVKRETPHWGARKIRMSAACVASSTKGDPT